MMSVIGLPHTEDITLTSWGLRAFSTKLHEYGGEDVVEGCFEEKIDRVIWRIFFPPSSCVHVCVHSRDKEQSPLDCKEIQLVYPKGDYSWMFIGRTDAESETPILWPPHAKS